MRLVHTNKQKGDEIQMTFKDLTEILEAIIKLTPAGGCAPPETEAAAPSAVC